MLVGVPPLESVPSPVAYLADLSFRILVDEWAIVDLPRNQFRCLSERLLVGQPTKPPIHFVQAAMDQFKVGVIPLTSAQANARSTTLALLADVTGRRALGTF